MATHDHAAGHGSPDDQYRETPLGAGYEHTDATVGIIAKFMAWLAVAAVVIHLGMWAMFVLFVEQRRETAEPQFPLAVGVGNRLPPEPRLQQSPRLEYEEFRLLEDAALQNYGWMDRASGSVRIPIEDAMRLTVERGLPTREGAAAVDAAPRRPPAGANSGRGLERRQP